MDFLHEGRDTRKDFSDGSKDETSGQPTDMNKNDETYKAVMITLGNVHDKQLFINSHLAGAFCYQSLMTP